MRSVMTILVTSLLVAATIQAQAPAPVGEQFQVNTYTTSWQAWASVAGNQNGDFVVVWTSYGAAGTDTSGESVQGQRYDAAGFPVGDEFQVNTYTTGWQISNSGSLAVGDNGDFVVVWESDGSNPGTGVAKEAF